MVPGRAGPATWASTGARHMVIYTCRSLAGIDRGNHEMYHPRATSAVCEHLTVVRTYTECAAQHATVRESPHESMP